jgi:FkbM family methyltransferase
MYVLFPPHNVIRVLVHRLAYGNWLCKGYIWIRREFDTWLLAELDQIIDGCLVDEPRTWRYVKKLVLEGRVSSILDIGAHIGGYSVVLGKKIFSVAVEPIPNTFSILKLNATINRSNVRALRRAVWRESNKVIRLKRSIARSGADFVSDYEGNVEAETVTINDLWESLGPFDLVKIDAEGSEDKILQGFSLNEVSPRRNIYVVIEMRPATMTFCLKWLKRNSFKIIFQEKLVRSYMVWNLVAKRISITT